MTFYKLIDGKIVRALDVLDWGQWFENAEDRIVERTAITDDVFVSTVFLGLDHGYGMTARQLLFETMTFGGPHDQCYERTATLGEAKEAHWRLVKETRALVSPGKEPGGEIP